MMIVKGGNLLPVIYKKSMTRKPSLGLQGYAEHERYRLHRKATDFISPTRARKNIDDLSATSKAPVRSSTLVWRNQYSTTSNA